MNNGYRFSGCIPANLLPFTADLAIDVAAYKKHLRWLADTKGVTAIVANGHAAEVSSLSREERKRSLAIALDGANVVRGDDGALRLRIDGRGTTDIRPLSSEVGVLPSVV